MSSENKDMANNDICTDCGAFVDQGNDGCRRLFEEILAKEFSDYRYGRIHRLTVDSYALQHPDAYMRSGKSFAAHLTGMCAAMEFEDTHVVNQSVQKWLSTNPPVEKPAQLPQKRGNLTISYIHSAAGADEHISRVREWARDVWSAWSEHQALAKQLIELAKSPVDKA